MRAITDSTRSARQWLGQYRSRAGLWPGLAVAAGTLNALAIITQLALLAWLVDTMLGGEGAAGANPALIVALLLAAVLVRALSHSAQEIAGAHASDRVRAQVREELLADWRRAGPVGLSGEDTGALASEWMEQVEALDGYYARFLPQMVLAVVVPLLVLVAVASLDWLSALFLVVSAPLIPLFMALVGMGAERLNQRHFQSLARLSGHFLDRVRGLTTLQLFGLARAATSDVAQASDEYRRLNMKTLRLAFLSSAVLEFFASVAIAVVAIYVGFGLLGYIDWGPAPQLTLFSGLLVLLLAPEFFQPLRTLAQHYHDRAAALGAAAQLMARADPDEPPEEGESRQQSVEGGAVELTSVSVSYPERGVVLPALSLRLEPGDSLAVTGASGSGKSTLLAVLAGFVPPSQGQVSIQGLAPGQQSVAWMGQKPWLVQGSWAENLRLTAPEASDAQLQEAIDRVGLTEVLARQPQGLATPLGEDGRGLSGGQAHRLALARVFLTPATLVLLDEPTAGLDPETELEVVEALRAIMTPRRICVLASHRPALTALANRMLALGEGDHVG